MSSTRGTSSVHLASLRHLVICGSVFGSTTSPCTSFISPRPISEVSRTKAESKNRSTSEHESKEKRRQKPPQLNEPAPPPGETPSPTVAGRIHGWGLSLREGSLTDRKAQACSMKPEQSSTKPMTMVDCFPT
eukprot:763664-Hanusia_phi.AAC.2